METWEWITLAIVVGAALLCSSSGSPRSRSSVAGERAFRTGSDRSAIARFPKPAGAMPNRGSVTSIEHEQLDIRPLSESARERFLEDWRHAEARFVDDPKDATRSAERVVERVLADRGYLTDADTEAQAAHVAVDHPEVVERYRHGHAKLESVNGGQDTENLRKAMIDFRSVFEELVTDDTRTAA